MSSRSSISGVVVPGVWERTWEADIIVEGPGRTPSTGVVNLEGSANQECSQSRVEHGSYTAPLVAIPVG
jgi:hypothetical protein